MTQPTDAGPGGQGGGSGWGGGSVSQGGPPPPAGYAQQGASTMATVALVLGLASWVVGGLLTAIPGLIIGMMEMSAIDRGESPAAGRTFAQVGFWASLAHIIFSAFVLIVALCIVAAVLVGVLGVAGAEGRGW